MFNLLWLDGYGYGYCVKNNLVIYVFVIVKIIINILFNIFINLVFSDNNWEYVFWKIFNMFYFYFDIVILILRMFRWVNFEKGEVICILFSFIE